MVKNTPRGFVLANVGDQAGSFSWENYLKETNDRPAPKSCFKQAAEPPVNEFSAGLKMESKDPRNSMSYCVASVVYTRGARLCLRLDGSDNRNDFWCLVDSSDIHAYGWCESLGEQLQPPLGFCKNASSWPAFLAKLIQESGDKFAPKEFFKPEPPSPDGNLFEIGMKLEAVDRKNPNLICPATIGDLEGDKVYVQFDGWRGAFDYWCRYDCRDLFPVGWCASTGHPLQPPGSKGSLALRGQNSAAGIPMSISPNISVQVDTSQSGVDVPSPGSRSSSSKKNSPVAGKLISPDSLSPGGAEQGALVSAYLNQSCQCGPFYNKSCVLRMPLQFGPSSVQRVLTKVVQALIDMSLLPQDVFSRVIAGPSQSTVTAKVGGKQLSTRLPIITSEQQFEAYMAGLADSLQMCHNMISLRPLSAACPKCSLSSANNPSTPHTAAESTSEATAQLALTPSSQTASLKRSYSSTEPKPEPSLSASKPKIHRDGFTPKRGRGRGRPSRGSLSRLSVASGSPSIAKHSSPTSRDEILPEQSHTLTSNGDVKPPPYTQLQESVRSPVQLPANPSQWSTEDVIQFVRSSDPSLTKHVHLLQKHEIDGRAFLLMTSDIAIKYMQMKVGPALKLCSLIDQVRISSGAGISF